MSDITTFIIAGGKSVRMGQDKAFLMLAGKCLIEHAIDQARALGGDIFIVGSREKFAAYGNVIEDIHPGCGPLSGIHAALSQSQTELSLTLPVDTPLVPPAFLRALAERARRNHALVTVPQTHDGLQLLIAVYRAGFKEMAEMAIQSGKYKVVRAYPKTGTEIVNVRAMGFADSIFDNLNTPEDFARAKEILERDNAQADADSKS